MKRSQPLRSDPDKQRAGRQRSKRLAPVSRKNRERVAAWQNVRRSVIARDGYRCRAQIDYGMPHECTDRQGLDVHHMLPRGRGGTDDPGNLVTICREAHDIVHHREPAAAHRLGLLR